MVYVHDDLDISFYCTLHKIIYLILNHLFYLHMFDKILYAYLLNAFQNLYKIIHLLSFHHSFFTLPMKYI
jgi:hypothetical protein